MPKEALLGLRGAALTATSVTYGLLGERLGYTAPISPRVDALRQRPTRPSSEVSAGAPAKAGQVFERRLLSAGVAPSSCTRSRSRLRSPRAARGSLAGRMEKGSCQRRRGQEDVSGFQACSRDPALPPRGQGQGRMYRSASCNRPWNCLRKGRWAGGIERSLPAAAGAAKKPATNFATIPNHNPSHPITMHPRSPGTPDMRNPAPGAASRAMKVVAVGGLEPPARGL
jgi:hypothetical protein